MKYITLLLLFSSVLLTAQDALNVSLFGQVNRGDERYSGSWSYVDPGGSEYALIGAKTGTAIYTIDDPEQINEVGFIPGPSTNWREITVVGDYAYVVTDVGNLDHSLQVIDLTNLPESVSLLTSYTETFTDGHIIQKDIFSDDPYVYVCGTSTTDGVHIMDVSDPANPTEVGLYEPGYYIHDCHVRGDLLFGAAFYEGTFDIVDISDKTNPVLLARLPDPGANSHSSSLTIDGKYLFMADEQDGLPARIWNIEDLDNMYEVATYTANSQSLVHNPYIRGEFAFISHNTEGLRVVDIADPEVPVEVGYYDTWSGGSGGFQGLWSACPYFPSGKIIGGNRHDGLYIWEFNDTKAGRVYGTVVDSLTEEPIFGAAVLISENGNSLSTDLNGEFNYGDLAGTYTIEVSQDGYITKTFTVELEEGSQEDVVVKLAQPVMTSTNELGSDKPIFYPNPSEGIIRLDLNELANATSIDIKDLSGKRVFHYQLNNDTQLHIDLNSLSSGIYLGEIKNANGKVLFTEKLILQ